MSGGSPVDPQLSTSCQIGCSVALPVLWVVPADCHPMSGHHVMVCHGYICLYVIPKKIEQVQFTTILVAFYCSILFREFLFRVVEYIYTIIYLVYKQDIIIDQ